MSVIDLAQAIDEGRKAFASAKALYEAEAKKVEDLRAAQAVELAKASSAVSAAEAVVSSHYARLQEMSKQMLSELGHHVEDDMKSIILAAQKNRK
jgi:hypothetical protein